MWPNGPVTVLPGVGHLLPPCGRLAWDSVRVHARDDSESGMTTLAPGSSPADRIAGGHSIEGRPR